MSSEDTQTLQAPSEALIYHNGIPVAVCPAKDIRRDGLLLFCGPLHFHRSTHLEVELTLKDRRRFRVPVEVASCTPNHLDLHFRSLPEGLEESLPGPTRAAGTPETRVQAPSLP